MKATSALQFSKCGAGIDCVRSQGHPISEMIDLVRRNQGGGGIKQHYIAAGGFFPGQDFADYFSIDSGVSSGDVCQRGACNATILLA